jgi:hypothetical protein
MGQMSNVCRIFNDAVGVSANPYGSNTLPFTARDSHIFTSSWDGTRPPNTSGRHPIKNISCNLSMEGSLTF